MDSESQKLLEETLALTQENNQMLHKMRRSQFWANVTRYIYWIFIIGSAVGAYYYIQPYLDPLIKAYTNTMSTLNSLKSIGR
jgi:Trk-type K+ transport system membrane component